MTGDDVATLFFPDLVKFPVKPSATMFVSTAYDPALAVSTGIPVANLEDCLIRCHEVSLCEAAIMASQLDSRGNNCYWYQKRSANLTFS